MGNFFRTYQYHILVVVVVLLAVFLRTANLDKRTIFSGDEGMDLIIVWNMEHNHHRPLIGPFLSVENIFIPPTYYYIVWLFYHFNPTPEAVVSGFFVMNIVSILVLMAFTYAIAGPRASIIIGSLLALSWQFIAHGRQFWQPFPVQLFVALWLLTLWHAYTTRSFAIFALSGLFFAVALSIYPTTVLLAPLAGYHMYRWFRTTTSSRPLYSLFFSAATALLTALPVFVPQVAFMLTHEYPTFKTLASFPSQSVFSTNTIEAIRYHALFLVDNVFNVLPLGPEWQTQIFLCLYAASVALLYMTLRTRRESSPVLDRLFQFFPPGILSLGLLLMFYTPDINNWRLWGILSIELIMLAVLLSEGLRLRSASRSLSVAIFIFYCLTNGLTSWKYIVLDATDDLSITHRAAKRIQNDMADHNVSGWNAAVRYRDGNASSYNAYRVMYWLVKDRTITIPLLDNGNVSMDLKTPPVHKTLYLVCDRSAYTKTRKECAEEFGERYPMYSLERMLRSRRLPIYVFTKKQNQESTDRTPVKGSKM